MSLLSEDSALVALPGTRKPPCVTAGGSGTYRAGLRGGSSLGKQVVKFWLSVVNEMGERTGMNYFQV
jgi:hypothetical protein